MTRSRTITFATFVAALAVSVFASLVVAVPAADSVSCTVAAAGDVAGSDYRTGAARTVKVIQDQKPAAVLALGDLAYEDGSTNQFNRYYNPTWGKVKRITKPTPGNHEYRTRGAAGYFNYFDGIKPQYSFDVCGWHIVSLNSEVSKSSQTAFLKKDVAKHKSKPLIVYWHKPRWSSGNEHGNDPGQQALWKAAVDAGAKIVLNGHDHNYERFAEMDANGKAKKGGTREFVSGLGGHNPRSLGATKANSQKRVANELGVLFLTLKPSGYDWNFRQTDGKVGDRGTRTFDRPVVTTTSTSTTTSTTEPEVSPASTTDTAPEDLLVPVDDSTTADEVVTDETGSSDETTTDVMPVDDSTATTIISADTAVPVVDTATDTREDVTVVSCGNGVQDG